MKIRISILCFLISGFMIGQNPEIKAELPTIIPPSPTVAALMKFEEVPVSNYTGTPDISIPLFNSKTLSKDINLEVALKYHSANIKPENVAGDTGLGWSLFAGGTISRTVRGLPDEVNDTQGFLNGNGKIGLYHNQYNTSNNDYYRVYDYIINNNLSQFDQYKFNKFFFEAVDKRILDTQLDLWQFNFMGKSGKFLIKKDINNNILVVKNLDLVKEIDIKVNYDPTTFVVSSFELYDNLGYKYIFDVIETTLNSTTVTSQSFVPDNVMMSNLDEDKIFNSSFHLSKIFSPNNQLILEFKYNETANVEYTTSTTEEFSEPKNLNENMRLVDYIQIKNAECPGSVNSLGPKFQTTTQQTKVNTKKLIAIDVINTARIGFNFQLGREDSKLINNQSSMYLSDLIVKDWSNNLIKKVKFNYVYRTSMYKRMHLESVEFQSSLQNTNEKYSLQYKDLPSTYSGERLTKDMFGYLTIIPNYNQNYYYKEVNPAYVATDVLQKIINPTKGTTVFDFQSNTYSYEGAALLTSFEGSTENWETKNNTVNFTKLTSAYQDFFTINESQDVYLSSTLNVTTSDFRFSIYKFENNTYTQVGGIDEATCADGNCSTTIFNLAPGVYKVNFTSVDLSFPNSCQASITVTYQQKKNYQFNYGGGIRIDKIGYFKNNVDKNIFEQSVSEAPEKLIRYDYSNNNLSNGALVSTKPKFDYDYILLKLYDSSGCTMWQSCNRGVTPDFQMKKYTTYNNIKGIVTQGADVGYRSVTVYESGKGYTTYEYTSPIDYPERRNDFYPFFTVDNVDFKRGLLKKQSIYNESSKVVSESIFDFLIEEAPENETIYGLNCYVLSYQSSSVSYNPISSYFGNYDFYNVAFSSSVICHNGFSVTAFSQPSDYVHVEPFKEAYGWAKLNTKTTKEYFYPNGSSTPNIVQTNESFTYNPTNKQIASHSVTTSLGQNNTTNYYYHTGNSIYSQNRIAEIERIETFKAGQLVSENKINYHNAWTNNVAFLPQTIQTKKGTNAPEIKVRYTNYDEFGNARELQQEDGMYITYLWGYNKTQPIAKIENARYADVQQYEANLQTLSNGTDENALLLALNTLRSNFPNAMVTTYTHKPLIGVSTVTSPVGEKVTYTYDEFNRLKQVIDHNGNILNENQYNYRAQ